MRITISGKQGEGKTKTAKLIYEMLTFARYDVCVIDGRDGFNVGKRGARTPDILIKTRQVNA